MKAPEEGARGLGPIKNPEIITLQLCINLHNANPREWLLIFVGGLRPYFIGLFNMVSLEHLTCVNAICSICYQREQSCERSNCLSIYQHMVYRNR